MSTESNDSAGQEPELPSLVLGRPDSMSDEDLLKFVEGLAKALRDTPKGGADEAIQIRADVFDGMIEQARADWPNECGGLLAGHSNLVTSRYPLRNTADFKTNSFVHNTQELLGAYRDIRERGLEVIAYYHSHPDAPAQPSWADVEWNPYANLPQIIISISLTAEPSVKAFRLYNDGHFEELPCERTPN